MFKERLLRFKQTSQKVSIHVNEHYTAIGTITGVDLDCVELHESYHTGKNPVVIIPTDKIKYIRPIK